MWEFSVFMIIVSVSITCFSYPPSPRSFIHYARFTSDTTSYLILTSAIKPLESAVWLVASGCYKEAMQLFLVTTCTSRLEPLNASVTGLDTLLHVDLAFVVTCLSSEHTAVSAHPSAIHVG